MLENALLIEVKDFVFNTFKNELLPEVIYHNFNHTQFVVNAVNEIAKAEKVNDNDLEIVLLAAWFHDIGFVRDYKNHEEYSKEIASKFLKEKGVSAEKISKVCEIIDATKMPQSPKNKLGEIICDADLQHLGQDCFKEKSNLLRAEWEQNCNEQFTDIEWLKKNEGFIKDHKFFTNYAFNKFEEQKTQNWLKIKKDLKKSIVKEKEQKQKVKLKSEDQKRKKEKEDRPEKGIETMYRVTLRNHIKLSDIADTKANILLSVSAIILSIALSSLFPKLDKPDNAYLVIPTLMFLVMTVLTMIFSILSTRPKVTSGKFTKEDIKNKKVNLLFFGNFHQMELEEFQEGMKEIMKDRDYLYETLMKDLYFLGVVLQRKYKLLRIAYTIFMVGIILSVIAFIFSFELFGVPIASEVLSKVSN
ncbi:Pycsar system effector family protein [uncultured Lutibacter sp.]|uniref:Pycsar system effector family protein n=1 Tax=uncultured Lutibacter sp. TaxID=437739 RepID=UPI0026360E9D|nr:Pycsar system effector family protein [uncultured Lutibacter sp.]